MSELIHHDIQEEILTRSQVDDLISWKSVCKSWNSLISSRRFVNSHLSYNIRNKADNNEIGDTRIDFDSNYRGHYRLVGSSNGLLCFHNRDDYDIFVVNPSTREAKKLRNPLRAFEVSGFGYDSSIDDFKVVLGFYNGYNSHFFKVLTLKSDVWRSVAGEVEGDPLFKNNRTYGTLYNGVIHWPFYGEVIVTFDLSKEVIIEIPIPEPPCDRLYKYDYTLGTIKDSLCIIYKRVKNEEIEIWVMKNYNVMKTEGIEIERWLPPPGYDEHKTIMKYTPHEKFFYGHVHIWMLEEGSVAPILVHSLESPNSNSHIMLSTISECNYNFGLPVFVKSLVSLHGMGEDYVEMGGRLESIGMLEEGSYAADAQPLKSWSKCSSSFLRFLYSKAKGTPSLAKLWRSATKYGANSRNRMILRNYSKTRMPSFSFSNYRISSFC